MKDEQTLEGLIALSVNKPFNIPSYQRGYRWQPINVTDLLNDLCDFIHDEHESYSLQPLVVKDRNDYWNVVDGQQRLTTLKILLNYLEPDVSNYELKCESRPNQTFGYADVETNIDQYHVNQAFNTIKDWFNEDENKHLKKIFLDLLHDRIDKKRVKFIWFETPDDEVRTFIRLNKNKISLTNSELIKAMLLRKGNFDYESILMQKSIASAWNSMEDMFYDDSFWYFLRPSEDNRTTRIDYIFQIIKDKNYLDFIVDEKKIGTDKYATFRYFYEFFKEKKSKAFELVWSEVTRVYNILEHWFNEVELYHYIGLLVENNAESVYSLLDKWMILDDIENFKKELYDQIKNALGDTKNLNKVYELKGHSPKTRCTLLLLLFNVETILIRNRNMQKYAQVQIPHKFPFYLYKKEKWDIEHIASNTDNTLEDKKSQKEWLMTFVMDDEIYSKHKDDIESFIIDDSGDFETLRNKLIDSLESNHNHSELLSSPEDKNQVWNFCLLDRSTNRSYGNSIFPVKRWVIMGKELGRKFEVKIEKKLPEADESNIEDKKARIKVIPKAGNIAYVPACTMNVFLKAYTATTTSSREWTKTDAKAYKQQLYETLSLKFGVTL